MPKPLAGAWLFILIMVGLFTPALALGEKNAPVQPAQNFDLPANGLPSIVKLGADWCPPCRAMKPVIADLTVELKGRVNVLDVDIEEQRELARKYKVRLIPTIVFLDRQGVTRAVVTGFQDKQQLKEKLKSLGLL
ncbi:MAG: thioredoxin family protein [Candidatus Margulisbacteria bacterium]|jgi:thioredoxin 1|nr:thioredoxin family protein [Candidatus Margulisiibacteriota bacterium]